VTGSDIQNLRDLDRDLARLRAQIHLYERALEGNPTEDAEQVRKQASEDWWLEFRQRLHSCIQASRKSAAKARPLLDSGFPELRLGFEVQVLLDDVQDWFLTLAAGPVVADGSVEVSSLRPRLEMLATRVRHAPSLWSTSAITGSGSAELGSRAGEQPSRSDDVLRIPLEAVWREERMPTLRLCSGPGPDGVAIDHVIRGRTRARLAWMVIGQPRQTHKWSDLLVHGVQTGFWTLTSPKSLERQGRRICEQLPASLRGFWQQDGIGVRWDIETGMREESSA
jgi:hypothetical protein